MSDQPRDLPHISVQKKANVESFAPRGGGSGTYILPQRNPIQHSRTLEQQLAQAISAREQVLRENADAAESGGFYLDFKLEGGKGAEVALESLENRQGGRPVELMAVKESDGAVTATVFVPDGREALYAKKLEAYRTSEKPTGKLPHQKLIAQIDEISFGTLASLYTDKTFPLPEPGRSVWWEAWLVKGVREKFDTLTQKYRLATSEESLVFREREVVLVYATLEEMERLIQESRFIAELRASRETPFFFISMNAQDQKEWIADLRRRAVKRNEDDVYVCVLDGGIGRVHPLLQDFLKSEHSHTVFPTGTGGDVDNHGHGTQMAGMVIYGDITMPLQGTGDIEIQHNLESSKILQDVGANSPKLYGYLTKNGVYLAEIANSLAVRIICMAVTDTAAQTTGKPSSWSAAIDQLAFEDDETQRLIILSAGNARPDRHQLTDYPDLNDLSSIESPAQAWNALTVGAFSTKTTIVDPYFDGYTAAAPVGGLAPTSRTSILWDEQWPIKPEVVFEGGNKVCSPSGELDFADDVLLLTTHNRPGGAGFLTTMGETSAATALASRMAAKILVAYPALWPETARALIVHSASWTEEMLRSVEGLPTTKRKATLLRRYGYGTPNLLSALRSARNDFVLMVEDSLTPYEKEGSVTAREMNTHHFPWPEALFEAYGDSQVKMRITLSYFIDPNPGERGWGTKHAYASHGLRFSVKNALETDDAFKKRINKAAHHQGEKVRSGKSDKWHLGNDFRKGSIFSDWWEGSASELLVKDAVAVYPVGGWWKNKAHLDDWRRPARYALIVSIEASEIDVDIYTPVKTAVGVATAVDVDIPTS